MATPWKPPPPPMPGSNHHLRPRPLSAPEIAGLRAAFAKSARDLGRPLVLDEDDTRTVRTRRAWRPLEDTAARFAAPWLALAWVLTLGRMGAPLWRRVPVFVSWHRCNPENPPRGGSGVPPWPGPDPGRDTR